MLIFCRPQLHPFTTFSLYTAASVFARGFQSKHNDQHEWSLCYLLDAIHRITTVHNLGQSFIDDFRDEFPGLEAELQKLDISNADTSPDQSTVNYPFQLFVAVIFTC